MGMTVRAVNSDSGLFVTNERAVAQRREEDDQQGRKTLFAGNLAVRPDPIQLKREQARKQALKLVGDAYQGQKKADEAMDAMAAQKQGFLDAAADAKEDLKASAALREELTEGYGVDPDSQEQKDLELLRKEIEDQEMKGMDPQYESQLTEDEVKRLEEIHEAGYTDYQRDMLELDEREKVARETVVASEHAVLALSSAMGDMLVDSLKDQSMIKASGAAEEIVMAANKDIVDSLRLEGKEHLEEKAEETSEKIQEKEEQEREEEEKTESRETREDVLEEPAADSRETSQTLSYSAVQSSTDRELEELLDKLKLIDDDLKGAVVDSNL